MKRLFSAYASRPFSWGAVFAGVVVGTVASMAVLAIGAFITFMFGLSFSLTGYMGIAWFAASALVGAFVAGNVAINAQAPAHPSELVYQTVTKTHATLTGVVTAAVLVLFTTYFTVSGIGSIIGTTANIAGSVGNAVGNVVGSTAQTVANASDNINQSDFQSIEDEINDITKDDVAEYVAKNNDTLSQAQVEAVGEVVADTVKRSGRKVKRDITDIQLENLDDYLKARFQAAKDSLTHDDLVLRLQGRGLTRGQAVQVQQYFVTKANELEAEANRVIAETKQTLEQAEENVREAARWTALSWLISTLLTFLATIGGAHSAVKHPRE